MKAKNIFLHALVISVSAFSLSGCTTADQQWFSSLTSEAMNYASALGGGQSYETATLNMATNVINNSLANSEDNTSSIPVSAEATNNTTTAGSVTPQNINISSEIASVDLSGNCDAAQAKGTAWANKLTEQANARGPAICESARDAEKAGEVMVRVARACKNLPSWQEEEAAGIKLINEARETQRGSCA